jgi:hypothetical protein
MRARTHTHRKTYTTYCFPLQQLFRKRNSLLRYAQIYSLVIQNIRKKVPLASSGVCTTFWAPWRTAVVSISFYFWTGHCKELACNRLALQEKCCTQHVPRKHRTAQRCTRYATRHTKQGGRNRGVVKCTQGTIDQILFSIRVQCIVTVVFVYLCRPMCQKISLHWGYVFHTVHQGKFIIHP